MCFRRGIFTACCACATIRAIRMDPGERTLIHGTINHGTPVLAARRRTGSQRPISGSGSGISPGAFARSGERGRCASACWDWARASPRRLRAPATRCTITRSIRWWSKSPIASSDSFARVPADKHVYHGRRTAGAGAPARSNIWIFWPWTPFQQRFRAGASADQRSLRDLPAPSETGRSPGFNISNRYLDLEPVVARAARELGWTGS